MPDPRTPNARAYHATNGMCDGVELVYVERPSAMYALVLAELIGEAEAAGNTVATCTVLNKDGLQVGERVWLAWAWPELGAGKLLPGNPNGQHMVVNGYDAAAGKIGPLGLYVGDGQGNQLSDLIGGVGLPNNRHVCYRFVWKERGASDPGQPPPSGGGDFAAVISALERINATLREGFRLP